MTKNKPYRPIFYDTETTGIKTDRDRIIEIAAFDPIEKKSFCKFVNPQIPIPKEASDITHITDEMVKDAPTFNVIGKEFIEFCSGKVILIAHNNDSFDAPLLKNEMTRSGLKQPEWLFLDSLKWARKYRFDLPRHNLQFLRESYNIPANQAHRALDDVMVLYEIFTYLTDDLSIYTVYELMQQQQRISHMPFGKHQGKKLSDVPKHYIAWLKENKVFEKKENELLTKEFETLGLL